MARPVELDVPHWATTVVKQARDGINFGPKVTDRMIYARMLRNAEHKVSKLEYVKQLESLNEEVL